MTSERIQRRIERFLDDADEASARSDWAVVRDRALNIIALDRENPDAKAYLEAAEFRLRDSGVSSTALPEQAAAPATGVEAPPNPAVTHPASFVNARYQAKRFLGEGGKKRVYLAHDTLLDRDVAFALIKTEGLDAEGRERVVREAQAMGKLGTHPHIVSVFDMGQEGESPYLVTELMGGGDVEGLLEKAEDHRLPIERAVELALQVCTGLEFAHEKGLVHRDLKPGNVWLTTDGTAKIGDFGLAVSLDRSRLTRAGMMVGTVSYMPPEQATGGEVTVQSDLYSLGCMLYELVTGRPPFIGDDSVAIIGQHLNTPPVSPTWHRPDCPPGLEALISRLLQKDARKRPASAAEAREALADLASGPTTTPETSAFPEQDPLYRRAFVGREPELRQLHAAFDAALSGRGGLVMVVGEPGIGKTSVVEQLAIYVSLRGGKALMGHCYEEGSLSLPYLPFVEAMRSYVLAREPDGLRSDLGTGAGEVARIVSEVRDRVQVVPAESGDPEEQRWRLLQAVTGFLRNASSVTPLLVVLEDLHDADRGTLDLLVHLSRNLEGARLLIAGTYRDVEVDRQHPLSNALADLRRVNTFLRVPLRGMTADEVQRMMAAVAQRDIPFPFAELVHRQTEGNPLFVQEMLRYLVEEGLVSEQDGSLRRVGDESLAGRIPEGLRDVIGKRLSRLADRTNQALSVASVIGREFRLEVLQRVADIPEEELIAAMEEATAIAVIEERSTVGAAVTYRFTHAFFRQTLYEELSAPRRIRWHQQVARALEQAYGRRVEEHAAELAEHFSHSSTAEDLRKAVEYGELAAGRALGVYAYGEAVRHLEQALEVQEVLDADPSIGSGQAKTKRCDLLLALGEALVPAGNPERAFTNVAEEAYALAEELGDADRACRACRGAEIALRFFGGTTATGTGGEAYRRWTERYDLRAQPGTVDRVLADFTLAALLRQAGRDHEAWLKHVQAFRTARYLGDEVVLLQVVTPVAGGTTAPVGELALRLEAAETVLQHEFRRAGSGWAGPALMQTVDAFLTWGRRAQAEEAFRRLAAWVLQNQDLQLRTYATACRALFATWDGELERVVELADELVLQGQAAGQVGEARAASGRARRRALLYLGRPAEALAGIPQPQHLWATGGVYAAQRAIYLAYAGQTAGASEIIDQFLAERDFAAPGDTTAATLLRYLLEAAVAAGHQGAAAILEPLLAPLADLLFTEPNITNCMGRDLGGAAALLGQPDKARAYYQQGIAACEKGSHRPELALTRLQLAELLLDCYPHERAEAIEHLDFAIAEFREMKMQPSLERALRRRGLLKA